MLSAGRGGAIVIVIVIVMDAGNTNASEALSTGGNAFLYSRHALLPRLGWFAGREQDVSTFYTTCCARLPSPPARAR